MSYRAYRLEVQSHTCIKTISDVFGIPLGVWGRWSLKIFVYVYFSNKLDIHIQIVSPNVNEDGLNNSFEIKRDITIKLCILFFIFFLFISFDFGE